MVLPIGKGDQHGRGGIAPLAGSILAANRLDAAMPLVNVRLIEGVFTDDQKHEIVENLTDTMVEIEGENMRGVTWVVIDEVKSGDWGIGGQALTTEHVRELAAGAPA
jgi:4-oxalocrotonate tautomerase